MACSFQKRRISSSRLGKLCLLSTGLNMVHLYQASRPTFPRPPQIPSRCGVVADLRAWSALRMTDRLFQLGEALPAIYGSEHGALPPGHTAGHEKTRPLGT